MTNRCVVCGSLPSEECNQRTHDAHYRYWKYLASQPDGAYLNTAKRTFAALDAQRANT